MCMHNVFFLNYLVWHVHFIVRVTTSRPRQPTQNGKRASSSRTTSRTASEHLRKQAREKVRACEVRCTCKCQSIRYRERQVELILLKRGVEYPSSLNLNSLSNTISSRSANDP